MMLYLLSRKPGSRKLLRPNGLAARWNREDMPCRYLVDHPGMCTVESGLAEVPPGIPPHYFIVPVEVPEGSIRYFREDELPEQWRAMPVTAVSRDFGSAHLGVADKLVLAFPSVNIGREWTYVLNLRHPLMKEVKIGVSYLAKR
ncbi:RES family NAD+ phosphorylase [Chitinophaga deserti]|uniref:RES family NAD+ phosphorylase n=1 Tax=Chitinophaga deserti TaxID=2164099 RepID=UPI0013005E5D|nr:RES family NAD+ phosphorylase [Chitinophaga deserti]